MPNILSIDVVVLMDALPEASEKWQERAQEVRKDSSRLLIAVHNQESAYLGSLRGSLGITGRYLDVPHSRLDEKKYLQKAAEGMRIILYPGFQVFGYGLGDVTEQGKKVMNSLGLSELYWKEI